MPFSPKSVFLPHSCGVSLHWCAGCVTSPAGHILFGRSFTCQSTVWYEITNCNHHSGLSLTKQCFCDTMSVMDITKLYNYHKQRQGIGMENQFIRHEPCFERILFVLTLDRKKMKERILIGEEQQIRFRLNGSQNAEVLCDMTRPLGTFLINFERDTDRDWNLYGLSPLRQALHSNRWEQPELEQAASEFLWEKYLSNDPLKMYVAFRIWNSYLLAREPRDRNAACDRFMDKMSSLTGVFHNETMSFDRETGKPKHFQAGSLYFKGAPSEDTRLDLWFPDNRRTEECVSAYASLYPLITYYLNRLNDWGLCFRRCKVCGKYFLAKSQRYELCSDNCRKAQALQNKREFDERARENNYDLLYKNECQNWRNKINKAKRTAGFPADQLEEMLTAFEAFKKEALKRKKAVKEKTASPKEFTDWLYQQSNIIINLSVY